MKQKDLSIPNKKISPCHNMVIQNSLILKESKIPRTFNKSLPFRTPTAFFSNSKVARPTCSWRRNSLYMNTRIASGSINSKKQASHIEKSPKEYDLQVQPLTFLCDMNDSPVNSHYNETISNSSSILKHNDSCASSLSSYIEGASKNFKNIVSSLSISSSSPVLCRKKFSPVIPKNFFESTSHIEHCNYTNTAEKSRESEQVSQSQVVRNSKDSTRTSSANSIFEPLLSPTNSVENLIISENFIASKYNATYEKTKNIIHSSQDASNFYPSFKDVSKMETRNKSLSALKLVRTNLGILFEIPPKECSSLGVPVCKIVMKLGMWFVILLSISLLSLLCLLEWFINPLDQMLI